MTQTQRGQEANDPQGDPWMPFTKLACLLQQLEESIAHRLAVIFVTGSMYALRSLLVCPIMQSSDYIHSLVYPFKHANGVSDKQMAGQRGDRRPDKRPVGGWTHG